LFHYKALYFREKTNSILETLQILSLFAQSVLNERIMGMHMSVRTFHP